MPCPGSVAVRLRIEPGVTGAHRVAALALLEFKVGFRAVYGAPAYPTPAAAPWPPPGRQPCANYAVLASFNLRNIHGASRVTQTETVP